MRPLKASILVSCPQSVAIDWAQRYFDERHRIIPIGLPLRAFRLPTFVHIFRIVTVGVEAVSIPTASSTPRFEQALNLTWNGTHTGPFPRITGVLTARAHSTHAMIDFAGSYTPPFGFVGMVFDRLVGRHIARLFVETLLYDIKHHIERINIEEHTAASFAAYEANLRGSTGKGCSDVPLHGSVAIRRDGSYLACAVTVEGEAPDFAALVPGEYALSPARVETLLAELTKPDPRIVPKLTAP